MTLAQDIQIIRSPLTFSVIDCKEVGKDGDKNVYDIDVEFDVDGNNQPIVDSTQIKKARFKATAGSLKVALEMIEALGQQTQRMDIDRFNTFKSKHATTVFRTVHHDNEQTHEIILTIFKNNRAHNRLVHAFAKRGHGFIGLDVPLTWDHRKAIDRLARTWAPYDRDAKKQTEAEKIKFSVKQKS